MPGSIRTGALVADFLCGIALSVLPLAAAAFFQENRTGSGTGGNASPGPTPTRFMVVAGEASGDVLAAELVVELRAAVNSRTPQNDLAPAFFGAGGPRMAAAGVDLAFDLTQHSIIGLPGPRQYLKLRERLHQLVDLAFERQPHAIICVDFQLFNSSFATAVKRRIRARRGWPNNWNPIIIKYISPQVWASREKRAYRIAHDFDLLFSIIPFEKEWFAARVPDLRVEFVGHPLVERHGQVQQRTTDLPTPDSPNILLLPGSRKGELHRHWPVMLAASQKIRSVFPAARFKAVVPNESLAAMARASLAEPMEIQVGGLADALGRADLAISKTGTITLECAVFGVPTVTLYIASNLTYQIGRHIVKVKWATMPNLIANEEVFPEFIQHDATPDRIAQAALQLLQNPEHRAKIRSQMAAVVAKLGDPGASRRAAEAILAAMP